MLTLHLRTLLRNHTTHAHQRLPVHPRTCTSILPESRSTSPPTTQASTWSPPRPLLTASTPLRRPRLLPLKVHARAACFHPLCKYNLRRQARHRAIRGLHHLQRRTAHRRHPHCHGCRQPHHCRGTAFICAVHHIHQRAQHLRTRQHGKRPDAPHLHGFSLQQAAPKQTLQPTTNPTISPPCLPRLRSPSRSTCSPQEKPP